MSSQFPPSAVAPLNDPIVEVNALTVRYRSNVAVDAVTLTLQKGTVYALLGRNGAGKSSLVRCLLGQQKPSSGRVLLFGSDVWDQRTALMERVGIVAEDGDAPPEMRVKSIGRFCASVYSRWNQDSFDRRIARFAIAPASRFGNLSKGQKKQVSLALALSSAPELLILDDPTLGLDVVARKSLFEEVIAELADRGITVLITTHDLAGVETIADRVGLLIKGRLVIDEEVESLKGRFRRIRTAARPIAIPAKLATAGVRNWGNGTEVVVTNYEGSSLNEWGGNDPFEAAPMSLEEIFIAVAGEEGAR